MIWPPKFLFIGGTLAVDFIHSGGLEWRSRWERWHSPEDLKDWVEASPDLGIRPTVDEADRQSAWDLRESVYRYACAVLSKVEPLSADAELIGSYAAKPDLVPRLESGKRTWANGAPCSQVLSTVARDAIALFGTDEITRFRVCANPDCQLMFVDHSRGGKRQWCTMERCGNLIKVARHRAKAKGDEVAS